jgi:outer membrane receptor for monomeric catechols
MKKNAIFLFIGLGLSTGLTAQEKEIKTEQKVLENTIKDKKEDKKEASKDLAHLKIKSALNERTEVRQHRRTIRRHKKHLKAHGVKHPMVKAQKHMREEKEMKKENK